MSGVDTASEHESDQGWEPREPQILCRAVNEQIRRISASFDFQSQVELVCDCTRPGCLDVLRVSPHEYERVRRFPTRFLLKPGHITDVSERIVDEVGGFVVVEKVGSEAEIAIRDDPRPNGSSQPVPQPAPVA